MPKAHEHAGGNAEIEVGIDHELCSGAGYCVRQSPDVFTMRDGKSWIRSNVDWSSAGTNRIEAAADACPWRAIMVTRR